MNCVLLQPASIMPPSDETFMILGSIEQDLCDCNLFPPEDQSPLQYLEESVVVCFSEAGALFSSVMVSPMTTPDTRDLAFTMDEHHCLYHYFWAKSDELHETTVQGRHLAVAHPDILWCLPPKIPAPTYSPPSCSWHFGCC